MTTLQETIRQKSEAFAQVAQEKMEQWRNEQNRLEREINELSNDIRLKFEKELAKLKLHWQQVEAKFSSMNRTDAAEWETAQTSWQETAVAYQRAFHQTADEVKKVVPLGWLQGYTDIRTMDSEGWAEGFGHRPSGSEGWAEGMGHKENVESKGWAEGYGRDSQS